jgi:hypothetical protein
VLTRSNLRGKPEIFRIGKDSELIFTHLNGSGAADLIVADRHGASLFMNKGRRTIREGRFWEIEMVEVPYNPPFTQDTGTLYPAVLDLLGSGNSQIVVSKKQNLYAAELNLPNQALLTLIDDGKGQKTRIDYARMKPEPGIQFRRPIVSSVEHKVTGKRRGQWKWDYSKGQVHGTTSRFLGFGSLRVTQSSSAHSLATEETKQFLLSDNMPPTVIQWVQTSRTEKHTSLLNIQNRLLIPSEFRGVPMLRLDHIEKTTLDSRASLNQISSFQYDENQCLSLAREESPTGTLTRQLRYKTGPLPTLHLSCLPIGIQVKENIRIAPLILNSSLILTSILKAKSLRLHYRPGRIRPQLALSSRSNMKIA